MLGRKYNHFPLSFESLIDYFTSKGTNNLAVYSVVRLEEYCRPVSCVSQLTRSRGGLFPGAMIRYPFQPTCLAQRRKFVFMWLGGKSIRTVARETGVSPSTVCRWINRWKQEGNVYNKPRSCSTCCAKAAAGKNLHSKFQYLHTENYTDWSLTSGFGNVRLFQ